MAWAFYVKPGKQFGGSNGSPGERTGGQIKFLEPQVPIRWSGSGSVFTNWNWNQNWRFEVLTREPVLTAQRWFELETSNWKLTYFGVDLTTMVTVPCGRS
jgi:hypothetical protein